MSAVLNCEISKTIRPHKKHCTGRPELYTPGSFLL